MVTYEDAPIKFKTGDEMVDQIADTISRKGRYMNLSTKCRKLAESRFLENEENISKYYELYNFPVNAPERVLLSKINSY